MLNTTSENVLMHIFNSEELVQEPTTKDVLVVHQEGQRQVRRRIKHYNTDAAISVGYRASSYRAAQLCLMSASYPQH